MDRDSRRSSAYRRCTSELVRLRGRCCRRYILLSRLGSRCRELRSGLLRCRGSKCALLNRSCTRYGTRSSKCALRSRGCTRSGERILLNRSCARSGKCALRSRGCTRSGERILLNRCCTRSGECALRSRSRTRSYIGALLRLRLGIVRCCRVVEECTGVTDGGLRLRRNVGARGRGRHRATLARLSILLLAILGRLLIGRIAVGSDVVIVVSGHGGSAIVGSIEATGDTFQFLDGLRLKFVLGEVMALVKNLHDAFVILGKRSCHRFEFGSIPHGRTLMGTPCLGGVPGALQVEDCTGENMPRNADILGRTGVLLLCLAILVDVAFRQRGHYLVPLLGLGVPNLNLAVVFRVNEVIEDEDVHEDIVNGQVSRNTGILSLLLTVSVLDFVVTVPGFLAERAIGLAILCVRIGNVSATDDRAFAPTLAIALFEIMLSAIYVGPEVALHARESSREDADDGFDAFVLCIALELPFVRVCRGGLSTCRGFRDAHVCEHGVKLGSGTWLGKLRLSTNAKLILLRDILIHFTILLFLVLDAK